MVNTITHRWFIGFYKLLESFASRTFIKCERSLFAKVQLVLSKTFNACCFWLLWQGRCISKRGSWLETWWNLFTLIWIRRFASFNKYQIGLYFLVPTILMVTENSDSQCWSEGLPIILNVKQRTRSTTFSFFSFSCKCCRFFLYVHLSSTSLTSLPLKHSP